MCHNCLVCELIKADYTCIRKPIVTNSVYNHSEGKKVEYNSDHLVLTGFRTCAAFTSGCAVPIVAFTRTTSAARLRHPLSRASTFALAITGLTKRISKLY